MRTICIIDEIVTKSSYRSKRKLYQLYALVVHSHGILRYT